MHAHPQIQMHTQTPTTRAPATTSPPTNHAHLAGKEGDCTLLRFEDGDDPVDEGRVGLLLQVGLKTDVGALHLGCHMYCEVGVSLQGERGRKEKGREQEE